MDLWGVSGVLVGRSHLSSNFMIALSELFASLVSTPTTFFSVILTLMPTLFLVLQEISDLHLSALSDSDILDGFVRHVGSDVLDLSNNIHTVDDLSKDHMLAVEMR